MTAKDLLKRVPSAVREGETAPDAIVQYELSEPMYHVLEGDTVRVVEGRAERPNVTITVSDRVWFIDSSASGSNLGTLSDPFTSIAAFNNANGSGALAPAAGDLIYLLQGSGYNEADGINLLDNQRLIGQRISLGNVISVDTASLDLLPPSSSALTPLLQTTSGNGVDLAADNTIRGLDIGDTPAGFAL